MLFSGTVDQCQLAIGHIARIIKAKCSLLCSQSKNRRIPRQDDTEGEREIKEREQGGEREERERERGKRREREKG